MVVAGGCGWPSPGRGRCRATALWARCHGVTGTGVKVPPQATSRHVDRQATLADHVLRDVQPHKEAMGSLPHGR